MAERDAAVTKSNELREAAGRAVSRSLGPLHFRGGDPPLSENPKIVLRDSLTYRAQSVVYHLNFMRGQLAAYQAQALSQFRTAPGSPVFLMQCQHALTFLADDVIFNVMSMLDYLGNLVGCTILGPNVRKLKWNGAVKAARDKSNRLSTTTTGRLMIDLHAQWIDRLHGIRSRLIHEYVQLGDGGQKITFENDQMVCRLRFELPNGIVNRLPFLKEAAHTNGAVDLFDGIEQIALRAFDATITVTNALHADLAPSDSDTNRLI
jgi:hypothetical protein